MYISCKGKNQARFYMGEVDPSFKNIGEIPSKWLLLGKKKETCGCNPQSNILLNKYTPSLKRRPNKLQSSIKAKSISRGAQYAILHTIKLDEEKSKCTGLAQENGFGLA